MSLNKLKQSNKVHQRLSNKHNDLANKYSDSSPKKFWHLVKRDYHEQIVKEQREMGKVLHPVNRKNTYMNCIYSLVDYRKDVNKNYGFNRYIPKKYR